MALVVGIGLSAGSAAAYAQSGPIKLKAGVAKFDNTVTAPLLQGGLLQQSSPLEIIQRKKQQSEFDAHLNANDFRLSATDAQKLSAADRRTAPLLQTGVNWITQRAPYQPLPMRMLSPRPAPYWVNERVRVKTQSLSVEDAINVSRQIDMQLSTSTSKGSGMGFGGELTPPDITNISAEITEKLLLSKTRKLYEVDGELTTTKKRLVVPNIDAEIKAQQAASKPLLDTQVALASTQLTAVFRRVAPPVEDLEAQAQHYQSGEDELSWDEWYKRVARASGPFLSRTVEKAGGPSGSNTVSITISNDHHVIVTLVSGGNKAFDNAIIRAYQSLNGNSTLAFPAGSRRTHVTFLADNSHAASGDVSGVTTQTCVGDKEVIRHR